MSTSGFKPARQRIGVFEIDVAAGLLSKRGIPVQIENLPFRVLVALLEQPGQIVTREELRQRLWPDGTNVVFEAGLNTAIRKLRQALGDSSETPLFIETLPRRGYRLIAPLTVDTEEPQSANGNHHGATFSKPLATSAPDGDALSVSVWSNKAVRRSILLGTAVVLVGLGFLWWHSWGERFRVEPVTEPVTETRLEGAQTWQNLAISPEGRYVAYARFDGQRTSLRLRQVAPNGEVEILAPDEALFRDMTFSPDGNYLYFVRSQKEDYFRGDLYRMPSIGGATQKLISDAKCVAISPDGRKLAFARRSAQVLEFRTANADGTGEELLTSITGWRNSRVNASWSPDGRAIVASFWHDNHWALATIVLSSHRLQEIYTSNWYVGHPFFASDGKSLIFLGRKEESLNVQLWRLPYPKGSPRALTSGLTYDYTFDVSRDGRLGAAVDSTFLGDLWFISSAQPAHSEHIALRDLKLFSAQSLADGKILAVDRDGSSWIMNADGGSRAVFRDNTYHTEACGKYVLVWPAEHLGLLDQLWRVDSDGTHATLLHSGGRISEPVCSAKDDFVFYVSAESPGKVFRIPLSGGTPVEIARALGEGLSSPLAVSRDGELLAYAFWNEAPQPGVSFAALRAKDGSQEALIPAIGATMGVVSDLRWSPDKTALYYTTWNDGVRNVWEQPLSGEAPKQITHFDSGMIGSINFSPDGKKMIVVHSAQTYDIILLTGLH